MRPRSAAIAAAAVLLAAGCTTVPPAAPPNVALAQGAIEAAHTAGADEAAPQDMINARAKLDTARLTANAGNTLLAAQLAEEAELDAHVARAKAARVRSSKALQSAELDLRMLRQTAPAAPAR